MCLGKYAFCKRFNYFAFPAFRGSAFAPLPGVRQAHPPRQRQRVASNPAAPPIGRRGPGLKTVSMFFNTCLFTCYEKLMLSYSFCILNSFRDVMNCTRSSFCPLESIPIPSMILWSCSDNGLSKNFLPVTRYSTETLRAPAIFTATSAGGMEALAPRYPSRVLLERPVLKASSFTFTS